MSGAEISAMLSALRSGQMTVDEVAEEFRRRTWVRARRPEPQNLEQRVAQLDPALPVPGSIDDVTAAYDRGELTWPQYRILVGAVTDALNADMSGSQARRWRGP